MSSQHTVFVIDNDKSVCRALQRLLNSAGLSVVTFASAEEFLQAIGQPEPIWLILDIHLPGLSGLELQRKLIADERHVPVIFISADDSEQTRKRALQNGTIAFLKKPVGEQSLLDAVSRAIAGDQPSLWAGHQGTIVKVNAAKNTITIKMDGGNRSFTVNDDTSTSVRAAGRAMPASRMTASERAVKCGSWPPKVHVRLGHLTAIALVLDFTVDVPRPVADLYIPYTYAGEFLSVLLIAGFSRETHLVLRGGLLFGSQRDRHLAAVNRVLLSLGEARQVLEGALAVKWKILRRRRKTAASGSSTGTVSRPMAATRWPEPKALSWSPAIPSVFPSSGRGRRRGAIIRAHNFRVLGSLNHTRLPVKGLEAEVALFLRLRAFVPKGKTLLAKPAVAAHQPSFAGSRPDMQLEVLVRAKVLRLPELPA